MISKYLTKYMLIGLLIGGYVILLGMPGRVSAVRPGPDPGGVSATSCSSSFFGLKPWYQYIPKKEIGGDCNIKCFNVFTIPDSEKPNDCGQRASDIPRVLLAVVDDLLRIAGLVALGFIIYAAFNFITSQGNPEDAAKARATAINALVGLIIAMIAVALVSFIGNRLGG